MARKNFKQSNKPAVEPAFSSQDKAENTSNSELYVCSHLHKGVIFKMPDGRKVRIAGTNDHLRGLEHAKIVIGGGVFTRVKAEDWDFIARTFKDWQAIKNGLLYAERGYKNAKAAMAERTELRDGFEPIDPIKGSRTKPTQTVGA